jgi:hypothetical protein
MKVVGWQQKTEDASRCNRQEKRGSSFQLEGEKPVRAEGRL